MPNLSPMAIQMISVMVTIFLLSYSIALFVASPTKVDPSKTNLFSAIIYMFIVISLAFVTFMA